MGDTANARANRAIQELYYDARQADGTLTPQSERRLKRTLMNELNRRFYKPAVPVRSGNVVMQYATYTVSTGVENYFFRYNGAAAVRPTALQRRAEAGFPTRGSNATTLDPEARTAAVIASTNNSWLNIVESLFTSLRSAIELGANRLANELEGARNVPELKSHHRVTLSMYSRKRGAGASGAATLENNPTFISNDAFGVLATPLMQWGLLTVDEMMTILGRILQSIEIWIINGDTVWSVTIIRGNSGGVLVGKAARSVIDMHNDTLCAARALVYLMARKWGTTKEFMALRRFKRKPQKVAALALHDKAGVPVDPQGVSFPDLNRFAAALGVQIMVVDKFSCIQKNFMYRTPEKREKRVVLYYEGSQMDSIGHFNPVTTLNSLFNVRNYCLTCECPYSNDHICGVTICIICKSMECDVVQPLTGEEEWSHCHSCNRRFPSPTCYQQHQMVGTCDVMFKCEKCKKTVKSVRTKHVCGESAEGERGGKPKSDKENTCKHCGEVKESGVRHVCYINPIEPDDCPEDLNIIYFDLETYQYLGPHHPNLVCAAYGGRRGTEDSEVYTFKTLTQFCRWLFVEEHSGYVAVAHNGKGYDFQFIRSWCVRNMRKITWISRGMKIMSMKDSKSGVKFVDSINFLAMPLAAFTKTFGLGDTADGVPLKKGYFPHFFNTPKNVATYNGALPAKKYFGPGSMSKSKRAAFDRWWEEENRRLIESGESYNLGEQLVEYCISDVRLLKAGMEIFISTFIEETGVNPLKQITIASTASKVYKSLFLTPKTLVRDLPKTETSKFMQMRNEWMAYCVRSDSCHMVFPKVSGKMDDVGYGTGWDGAVTAYFFKSDYMHGNLSIFDPQQFCKARRMRMGAVSDSARTFANRLEQKGYRVKVMWHSEWVKLRRTDEVAEVLEDPNIRAMLPKQRLNKRNAFFGGRTGATSVYKKFDASKGEYGCYFDICSLYPTVNYYDPYPVGEPTIFLYDELDQGWSVLEPGGAAPIPTPDPPELDALFGFVYCTVTCPTDLYHPVLPEKKSDGKLVFDLRSPKTGTWTTAELQLAVEKGYKIDQMYEAWHYTSSSTLFKGYVETFIRLKQEASGYPHDVNSEEEKAAFREAFKAKMGFEIREDRIESNPGRRAVAKTCLNSLWGKFGQRSNDLESILVYDRAALLRLIEDPRKIISHITPLTETAVEVGYTWNEEFVVEETKIGDVNIEIAATTTAHARIRLYQALDYLGKQALYGDTDSIIYKFDPTNPTHKHLPKGSYLGEWTDELEGAKMVGEFVSSGPKCYAYEVEQADGSRSFKVKAKGFSMNSENAIQLDHENMKRVVLSMGETVVDTFTPRRIRLQRSAEEPVYTTSEKKRYRNTLSKRYIVNEYVEGETDEIWTLPHGHEGCVEGGGVRVTETCTTVISPPDRSADNEFVYASDEADYVVVSDEEEEEECKEEGKESEPPQPQTQRTAARKKRRTTASFFETEADGSDDDEEDEDSIQWSAEEIAAQAEFIDDDDEEHNFYYHQYILNQQRG